MSARQDASLIESDYELLRLDNQLCFALYVATRAITKTYRTKLEPLGITYPQYLVLLALWENDGQTVSEIGGKLRLDSGTLTPLLRRLETMKLVTRQRGVEDEREVRAFLTSKGAALKDGALDARRYVACSLGMSEAEIMALRSDLMQLVSHLDAGGDCAAIDEAAE